jgi:[acyl-carrier-protein] S-malonyltransferase
MEPPKVSVVICFVFPGQGSQRPEMGLPWQDHPSWELVDEASEVAQRDLSRLLLHTGVDELSMTRNTQIATFLMSMVILDAIERIGISPQLCAGHSLGEYSALVAAGAVTFEAAVTLVCERGEAMQTAAEENPGAMAALLGADDKSVKALCEHIGDGIFVANYNSEGQTVLAGLTHAIDLVLSDARDFGIKRAVKIPVGGAFHTPLISSAQARLSKALRATRFYDSDIPVIANVDAEEHQSARSWPDLLSSQLCSPVLWRQSMSRIASQHPDLIVEVGPGGVLGGLLKRALPDIATVSVAQPADLETLLSAVTAEGPFHDWATSHHGERFYASERIVVAPSSGIFTPNLLGPAGSTTGQRIHVGDSLGEIGDETVRSPFNGVLQGMIAVEGERVIMGQPIAWLRNEVE